MSNSEPKGDIALIGLAVMGQNLILNMNDHGYTVVAYNRTTSKVDDFLAKEAKGTKVIGAHSIEEMCKLLKKPRRVMMLVKAGQAVDDFIDNLLKKFKLKLVSNNQILGFEITRNRSKREMFVSQQAHVKAMLMKFGFGDAVRITHTPEIKRGMTNAEDKGNETHQISVPKDREYPCENGLQDGVKLRVGGMVLLCTNCYF